MPQPKSQPSNQQSLLQGERPKRPRRITDFTGLLPDRVFPTGDVLMLEHHGNMLFVKSYGAKDKVTAGQSRMFRTMVRYSNSDSSPGNVTVACVWGLGPGTARELVVFDYAGQHDAVALNYDEWREWLFRWWHDSGRPR